MKPLSTSLSKILALTAIVLGGLVVNYLTIAWTGPGATPPSNNTPAPINAGSGSQTKTGDLTVDGNLVVNSAASVDGLTSYSNSNLFISTTNGQSFEIRPGSKGGIATPGYTTFEMPGNHTFFVWDALEVADRVRSDLYCGQDGNNCFRPENINNRQQLYLCPAMGDLNCGSGCTGGLSLNSICTVRYRDNGSCKTGNNRSCSATGFFVVK